MLPVWGAAGLAEAKEAKAEVARRSPSIFSPRKEDEEGNVKEDVVENELGDEKKM